MIAVTVILLIVSISVGVVSSLWHSVIGRVHLVDPVQETLPARFAVPEENLINPVPYEKNVTNILLLGIDSRDSTSVAERSDSMMILTINQEQRRIKLTSLQRDMLVYLPGSDETIKLNAANAMGGPLLTMRIIKETLRIGIDRYAVINIRGMEQVVDVAGGVELDITAEELPHVNGIIWGMNAEFPDTPPVDGLADNGYQTVNGRQAVAYARNRSTGAADYDRMGRQRLVLQALLNQFVTVGVEEKLAMVQEAAGLVTTNLTEKEILGLITSVLPMMNTSIEQLSIPIAGYHNEHSGLQWVNLCDFNGMIPTLQRFIYGRTYPFDPVREIAGAPNSSQPADDSVVNQTEPDVIERVWEETEPDDTDPLPWATESEEWNASWSDAEEESAETWDDWNDPDPGVTDTQPTEDEWSSPSVEPTDEVQPTFDPGDDGGDDPIAEPSEETTESIETFSEPGIAEPGIENPDDPDWDGEGEPPFPLESGLFRTGHSDERVQLVIRQDTNIV